MTTNSTMSAINRAAIDSLINTILTSQTAPESVTPQTLDDPLYAISESYFNKVDGIDVSGLTATIPGVSNGDALPDILSLIMAALSSINTNIAMTPNLFRAEKTADHIVTGYTTNTLVKTLFEDNAAAPNFDNSKLFYRDEFIANAPMVKTFVLEKLVLKQVLGTTGQWKTVIMVNGVVVVSSATVDQNSVDEYGNKFTDTDGFTVSSIVALNTSLAQGDIVTAGVKCIAPGTGTTLTLPFNHPAGKPTFYNG